MRVILVYDVNAKRVNRVRKIAEKYLFPVQKSVFEGNLSPTVLEKLKHELGLKINPSEDSIKIFKIENDSELTVDEIGVNPVEYARHVL